MKDLGIDYDFPGYVSYPYFCFIQWRLGYLATNNSLISPFPLLSSHCCPLPSPPINLLASSRSPNGFSLHQFSPFCYEVQVAPGSQETVEGLFCFKACSTTLSSSWVLVLWFIEPAVPPCWAGSWAWGGSGNENSSLSTVAILVFWNLFHFG